jgi:hypothetical protein
MAETLVHLPRRLLMGGRRWVMLGDAVCAQFVPEHSSHLNT